MISGILLNTADHPIHVRHTVLHVEFHIISVVDNCSRINTAPMPEKYQHQWGPDIEGVWGSPCGKYSTEGKSSRLH